MSRTSLLVVVSITIASLSGCNSQNSESKQVAREGQERDSAIEAAKNHPANAGNAEATGKPLPPLPGVDTPAPKTENESGHEEHQAEHNHP